MAVSHYLDALGVQRTAAKMMAVLGGKNPHPQSIVVGGVTCVEDIQNPARLAQFGQYLQRGDAVRPGRVPARPADGRQGVRQGGAGGRRRRTALIPVLRRLPARTTRRVPRCCSPAGWS